MCKDGIHVFSDYPGGNIKVIKIEKDTVHLEQDLKGSDKWWFYWNFCAWSDKEKDVSFIFENGEVVGPRGPAVSDDGVNWSWQEACTRIDSRSFRYTLNKNKKYFAFAFPYASNNWHKFIAEYPQAEMKTLILSEQGREVPLVISNNQGEKDILFTCRHHACESPASYVLEGILKYIFEHHKDESFSEYKISVVPFVDIDGVENGEQGKNRYPHDHNRDYISKPVYKSVYAITELIKTMNVTLAIDIHSPHKWGADDNDHSFTSWGRKNEHVFFIKSADIPEIKKEIDRFGGILARKTSGDEIEYLSGYDAETQVKNRNKFASFVISQGCDKFACTLEITYSGNDEIMITQNSLRNFGKRLGETLSEYLTY